MPLEPSISVYLKLITKFMSHKTSVCNDSCFICCHAPPYGDSLLIYGVMNVCDGYSTIRISSLHVPCPLQVSCKPKLSALF